MMNILDQAILIRAWSYRATLKYAGHAADYEFESIGIPAVHSERVPRVATTPWTYASFQHAQVNSINAAAAAPPPFPQKGLRAASRSAT